MISVTGSLKYLRAMGCTTLYSHMKRRAAMAQRVSSTFSFAVERLASFMVSRLMHCAVSERAGLDGHGFSGAAESGAAIFGTGIDKFQFEGCEQVWRGIKIGQGKGIIFPGPIKVSKPRQAIGCYEKHKDERQKKAQTAEGKRHLRFL